MTYGDDKLWRTLDASERPFFQKDRGRNKEDWTIEQEWRHPGDLALSLLPTDACFAFVPSEHEARRLAEFSRWPVAVLRA